MDDLLQALMASGGGNDIQALQARLQGLQQPQSTPADVFRMQQEALMNANRAGRMRTPVSGAGPLGAVVNYMGRKRGNEAEQAALDQLVKAMEAQGGIDSYQKQYEDIQAQIDAAMKRQQEMEDFFVKEGYKEGIKSPDKVKMAQWLLSQPPEVQAQLKDLGVLGGGVTVENNMGLPRPQAGYMWNDDNTAQVPIPGTPQAMEAAESQKAQVAGDSRKRYAAQNVLDTIDRLKKNTSGLTTGWGGLLADVPATAAKSYRNDLNTVMSNLAFDRLQQMRNESKTGGALGQVSNIELDLLKSTVAGLEQTQDPQDLIERLDIVAGHYKRFTDALNGDIPEGYETKEIPGRGRFIKVQGEWYPL